MILCFVSLHAIFTKMQSSLAQRSKSSNFSKLILFYGQLDSKIIWELAGNLENTVTAIFGMALAPGARKVDGTVAARCLLQKLNHIDSIFDNEWRDVLPLNMGLQSLMQLINLLEICDKNQINF